MPDQVRIELLTKEALETGITFDALEILTRGMTERQLRKYLKTASPLPPVLSIVA